MMKALVQPRLVVAVALFVATLASNADAAEPRSQSFTTAGEHEFVVPPGVTSLKVALVGGHGGRGSPRDGSESRGGEGESVRAQLPAIPGKPLFVEVAGNGENGESPGRGGGGYGGGGDAESHEAFDQSGGGGGGASDVRTIEDAAASRLVVAGGGGGGGAAGVSSTQPSTAFSGGGGGEAGARGQDGTAVNPEASGGEGGRPGGASSGGEAGGNSSVLAAGKGSEGVGGNGGESGFNIGGGGGGGIFGGGGGGGGSYEVVGQTFSSGGSGGGGGGASGVPAASGATLLQEEASAAEPSVTFTWIAPSPAVLTTSANALTTTTATVNGTVNPDNSLVTACQFAIAPAPPAGATIPCAQQVGAGGDPVSVSAAITGLAPATTYTVTLLAASAQGSTTGSTITFVTSASGPGAASASTGASDAGAASTIGATSTLTITNVKVSPTRFRRGKHTATITKKKPRALPTSTVISFALSHAATVTLSFELVQSGMLAKRKCSAVSKARRSGKRCTRYTKIAHGVTLAGQAGTDEITFDGVLGGGGRLVPGIYRLSLAATEGTERATASQHPTFTLSA
jgi:hypothetical protein